MRILAAVSKLLRYVLPPLALSFRAVSLLSPGLQSSGEIELNQGSMMAHFTCKTDIYLVLVYKNIIFIKYLFRGILL